MTAAALRHGRGLPFFLLLPAALVIAIFFGSLAVTGATSFVGPDGSWTARHYQRFLTDSHFLNYLWWSFRVALYCTPILGYPFAYVMARATPKVRLALTLALVIQFFTSYIVRTYAFILVLGKQGLINRTLMWMGVLDRPVQLLFQEFAVAVALVLVPLPFMILPIYSVLKNIEPNLETAASSLGANRLKVFWFVVFPLSLPGVIAGIVLVFLFDLTAYIMPAMLGGGYFDMVANAIQEQAMAVFDKPFASAISMIVLVITALFLYLITLFGSKASGEAHG